MSQPIDSLQIGLQLGLIHEEDLAKILRVSEHSLASKRRAGDQPLAGLALKIGRETFYSIDRLRAHFASGEGAVTLPVVDSKTVWGLL
jgi:hypothetical protein